MRALGPHFVPAAVLGGSLLLAGPVAAAHPGPAPMTIAVYGDAPYGTNPTDTTQTDATPAFIDAVNADADVSLVVHVGDIHSGKQYCTEAYDRKVAALWTRFADPLVYTPGDNEWTDCHKPAEGGGSFNAVTGRIDYVLDAAGNPVDYANGDPVANLDLVRSIFFAHPGRALGGGHKVVLSQGVFFDWSHPEDADFVENVMWIDRDVLFVTLDLPGGSNNDQDVWYGAPVESTAQHDERVQRTAADRRWLAAAFALADFVRARGVVVVVQADMWDPEKGAAHQAAYEPFVSDLARLTGAFRRPVLLLNGDSHVYLSDNPLAADAPLAYMHPGHDVPNFHRVVVHGSTLPLEYLKLVVDPTANAANGPDAFGPFRWQRVTEQRPGFTRRARRGRVMIVCWRSCVADLYVRAVSDPSLSPLGAPDPLYVRGMERLVGAIHDLSLARDLAGIMAVVRKAARDVTGADGATFVLRDGEMCFYADEDAIAPLWKGSRFPLEACVSGWAMLHREPVVIPDIYQDARVPTDAYRPTFVKSLAMVPIRTASPIGAIGNYWASPHRATPAEVKLLAALADSTSVAIENVNLYADLERRVKERTAQLEQSNRELESFSYSVSHDLRAPLRSIDGFSQALAEDLEGKLDDTTAGYLGRVRAAARRMGELIDDLLELSRTARATLERVDVDVTALALDVGQTLARREPGRTVELVVQPGLTASADPRLLRAALENLLGNAWKFTGKVAAPRVEVTGEDGGEGGEAVLAVRDNGAGFDMQFAARLFAPFQRLHDAREFPGTGVGLATVQRIVHRHGGRIWAESSPGQGATFRFTLASG